MADAVPNSFKNQIASGNIDFDADTFKLMLLDNNHSNDIDSQEFIDDVSTNEVSGTGYSAGGQTIANIAVTTDNANDQAEVDGDDVTWSSSSITARYGVVYKDTGTPATSPIVCILDFGSDKTSSNGDFTVQFGAEGFIKLS